MLISYENSWCWVEQGLVDEIEWLDDYLSVETTRYDGENGWVEERWRMLSSVGHRFPSGVLPMVVRAAVEQGRTVELNDQRGAAPCTVDLNADVSWLRDYQLDMVDRLCRAGRGIGQAPTGSGKTEVIVALTRRIPAEHLMLCHRTDLVDQAAARYRLRTGERAGEFSAAGGWRKGSCNFTVSTFQAVFLALKKKSKLLKPLVEHVSVLMVDEVHGQAAASYYRATQVFQNARWRFGFSGTPLSRGDVDALKTIGAIGPVEARITYHQLIAAGVLARPIVKMVRLPQEQVSGGWRAVYEGLIVRSRARNRLLAEMAEACRHPCMLFVDELKQGENVVRHLRAAGLRADFVHGGHPSEVRRRMLRDIESGGLDVLVCTVIFQEGIDVPSLRGVVVGGGKSSTVACLQRVGRGMRRAPGKESFEVWDVMDEGQKWLAQHSHDRKAALEDEGIEVLIADSMAGGRPT